MHPPMEGYYVRLSGGSVADVGGAGITAEREVYNLSSPADLSEDVQVDPCPPAFFAYIHPTNARRVSGSLYWAAAAIRRWIALGVCAGRL
jgi:hypothetical protein